MARRPPPPLRVRVEWVRVPRGSMQQGLLELAALGRLSRLERTARAAAEATAQAAPDLDPAIPTT